MVTSRVNILASVLAAEGLGAPALLPQGLDYILCGHLQGDKASQVQTLCLLCMGRIFHTVSDAGLNC